MDLQFYTDKVIIEAERDTSLVTLSDVNIDELVAQIPVKDLVKAVWANDGLSELVDCVTEHVNG